MAYSSPEKQREYHRRYYAENRDRMSDAMRQWRAKNGDKHRARSRQYHRENRETILKQKREYWRENAIATNVRRRENKFGMAEGAYTAMLAAQNGRCAICGDERKLVVDHNHKTGAVRALLCSPCNTAIGLLKEDTRRLKAAIKYLAKATTA